MNTTATYEFWPNSHLMYISLPLTFKHASKEASKEINAYSILSRKINELNLLLLLI